MSTYDDRSPEDFAGGYTEWQLVDVKSVKDWDDFWTDYTLWYNEYTDRWVCIFGDRDIYYPENTDYDAEFEDESEAREWFDLYQGAEEDDIYSTSDVVMAGQDPELSRSYDDLDTILGELDRNVSQLRKNLWNNQISPEELNSINAAIHTANKTVAKVVQTYL